MAKSTRLVKGAYTGIVSAIALVIVMLIGLFVYLNFFMTPPVEYEKVKVRLEEYQGDGAYGAYLVDEDKQEAGEEEEYISIKCAQSSMGFNVLSMRVGKGAEIEIYYSKDYGYTLYNPSNGKYDRTIYDSNYNKGYEAGKEQ